MGGRDRIALLRTLELFNRFSEERSTALAAYLEPLSFADGEEIFAENSIGEGLYFLASGRVRVTKRLAAGDHKDLASLGPGDCFGEMALLDAITRSAGAYACGPTRLLRLKRDDLKIWLATDASLAMEFFATLVSVQSGRLRRTSSELTLLYDLSSMLIEPADSAVSMLSRALERILPHLEGEWSACAHAYNPYNEEMDPAGAVGPEAFGPKASAVPPASAPALAWEDARTLALVLRSPSKLLATMRLRAAAADENGRAEAARMLTAVSRLLISALENIDFRADEALRRRLQTRTDAQSF